MSCIAATVVLALVPVAATANYKIPDQWRSYDPNPLKLKPGHKMYQVSTSRQIYVDPPGEELPRRLKKETVDMTPGVFARIRTEEQAQALCELLIHGAIVSDAKSYAELLKVHQDAGFEQLVNDKDLTFKRVSRPVEGGFQVEFTAFHLPQTMSPNSLVARYGFFVGHDANVKFESAIYLKGMILNWQTGPLDTKEAQEREAKALARVDKFVKDCYEHCSTRLPRIPEDKKVP